MNHFIAGILRIVLLEAGVALLVISRLVSREDPRRTRKLNLAFVVLAALSLFAWSNFGDLRGRGGIVHRWEQYHFFFGSKYLREVGYFDLYKATILADREGDRILTNARTTRDLATFDEVPVEQAMQDEAQVRAQFTDARWAAFKQDWQTLSRGDSIWAQAIVDHGNSASPAWAVIAAPIAYISGISLAGQNFLALLDPFLMVILFIFIGRTFGLRATCTSLWIWSLVPFCFDYLAGSFLRWDWLFALGMCLVFWQRKKPAISGAFLGYAVASKLFPLFFGIGLLFKALWDLARTRKLDMRIVRFGAGAVAAIALSVAISSAMFGGPSIWVKYAKRIEAAQLEKFYSNQYSFKTVFLQFVASSAAELESGLFIPGEIKQGRFNVDIRQYQGTYLICQLLLTALIAFALSRAAELEALAVGPLLVFIWLTVNAYYWNMLALPTLIWAARELQGKRGSLAALIFLHASLAGFYLYQHFNRGYAEGYIGGLAMLILCMLWSASTLLRPRAATP